MQVPEAPPPPSPFFPNVIASFRAPEVSIGIGISLLLALVTNRLFTEELLNSQSRADLIATVAPVVILLDALTSLDITPREADVIPLTGISANWLDPALPEELQQEIRWAANALLACTPCVGITLWRKGQTAMLLGQVSPRLAAAGAEEFQRAVLPGPLLQKCVSKMSGAPEYLPALQLLPGRVEFSYFPDDTQGVLIVPIGGQQGALILAADQVRAFKQDDVAFARTLALRVGKAFEQHSA